MPPVTVDELVMSNDSERQTRLDLNAELLKIIAQSIDTMDVDKGSGGVALKA